MMERYYAITKGDTTYVTDGQTRYACSSTPMIFAAVVDIGGCGTPEYDEGGYYNKFEFGLDRSETPNPNNENVEDLGEHVSLDAAARHWFG